MRRLKFETLYGSFKRIYKVRKILPRKNLVYQNVREFSTIFAILVINFKMCNFFSSLAVGTRINLFHSDDFLVHIDTISMDLSNLYKLVSSSMLFYSIFHE